MTRYFLIAGEASGDLHAGELIRALRASDTHATFVGMGGDRMESAGCRLLLHYRHMAFMGIAAVLANLGQVRRNFALARQALLSERPDVLILVDYPSFNLRIAAFCRQHLPQTRIVYYIPPKVWAWKSWRIHRIARLCDRVLGIFPHEHEFYKERGYACTYVGNPTVEEVCPWVDLRAGRPAASECPKLVLLPGSRRSEIVHCLPRMLRAARRQHASITVTAAPGIDESLYWPYLLPDEVLARDTHRAVAEADLAIVNSGTATLETALIGTPQIAVYHLACSWLLGLLRPLQRWVFPLPYFTLPNIILGRPVIRELLADEFTEDRLSAEMARLLSDSAAREQMLRDYADLRQVLGTQPAAATAAAEIRCLVAR